MKDVAWAHHKMVALSAGGPTAHAWVRLSVLMNAKGQAVAQLASEAGFVFAETLPVERYTRTE